jgi:hypothetical protein
MLKDIVERYDQDMQVNFYMVTQSWSVECNDEQGNRWLVGKLNAARFGTNYIYLSEI